MAAKGKATRPASEGRRASKDGVAQASGNRKAGPSAAPRPKPTMPVHALGDDRIHLALKQPGRLRQGYLKTLCGLQAVTALSPFAVAGRSAKRCRKCFGMVDAEGRVTP